MERHLADSINLVFTPHRSSKSLVEQDSKLRQIVTLGSQDTLEEKTVTVCYGSDFVTVSFINFCATKKEIAQVNGPTWLLLLTRCRTEILTKSIFYHYFASIGRKN